MWNFLVLLFILDVTQKSSFTSVNTTILHIKYSKFLKLWLTLTNKKKVKLENNQDLHKGWILRGLKKYIYSCLRRIVLTLSHSAFGKYLKKSGVVWGRKCFSFIFFFFVGWLRGGGNRYLNHKLNLISLRGGGGGVPDPPSRTMYNDSEKYKLVISSYAHIQIFGNQNWKYHLELNSDILINSWYFQFPVQQICFQCK